MYLPSHFAEERPQVLHDLIRAHPLGALVISGSGGLEANHIPFLLEEAEGGRVTLLGHVARANRIWENPTGTEGALVIFQGPAAYVSPGWYPSKHEHGKVVPTWNYVAVHARGAIRFHQDARWIRSQMERLTNQMEATQSVPWSIADAPLEYIEKMVANVVGVEVIVEHLSGKWKVSQNQPEANRAGVVQGLERVGNADAAAIASLVGEYSRGSR